MALALSGCASGPAPGSQADGMAAVAPMLSVERFLQASNGRDLEAMARLFGTAEGPVYDTGSGFGCAFKKVGSWLGVAQRCVSRTDVELRMDAIAGIIQHDDYRIVSESSVPGRRHPTTRIGVTLTRDGRTFSDVPFVVVRTDEGRWLVQEIGLERVTGRT